MEEMLVCKIHGLTEYSVMTRGKGFRKECKKCRCESIKRNKMKRKLQIVEFMGGQCSICSYKKNLAALELHHLNPQTKDFEISYYSSKKWEDLVVELNKCILICSNCHKEIHNPSHTLL
jgi:hypothetical protein